MTSSAAIIGPVQLPWSWGTRAVQRAYLWLRPDGGQAVARRNAWSAQVQDARRRTQRLEAERAVALVLARRQEQITAV